MMVLEGEAIGSGSRHKALSARFVLKLKRSKSSSQWILKLLWMTFESSGESFRKLQR